MSNEPKIPIKNIYHMLCYAWNVLDQSGNVFGGSEKFDTIHNLLARIYINGTSNLIKRGLNRHYIQETESLSTLRGKISIGDSLKQQTFQHGRMVCDYDHFSEKMMLNRIIKTTLFLLLKAPQVNNDLKKKLLKFRLHFSDVDDVVFSPVLFSKLRYHRNNKHYRMLMNVSELIYKGLIAKESNGNLEFADFIRDQQMSKLYEKFVLQFYRTHLEALVYRVHSPKINWDLGEEVDEEVIHMLPEMRTDIVVENKVANTQLIIDTKYYPKALVSSNWSDLDKIRTNHLYQIYAYLNNSQFAGKKNGVLLYPTVEKELNAKFPIGGKGISVLTLNLGTDWEEIEDRLLGIVG
ncbi:5-methylcytosine-specific restriction endonuclease system specificity protein McrC [Bacillus sp. JJ1533]|uniref:5-methylcytosine-specific restriction endonuclease system specificity protein McrC n=1 Tax=Bacillus sp. JJ1533 TaxID=3122959 RepID=UPI002FFDC9EC